MKIRQRWNRPALSLLVAGLVVSSSTCSRGDARARESANSHHNTKSPLPPRGSATALLERVAAKLQGASTYRADFVGTGLYPQALKDIQQRGTIKLARPLKWRIETTRFRHSSKKDVWIASGNNALSVSDGKIHALELIHPHSSQVRKQPVSAATAKSALTDLTPLAQFFASGGVELSKPTSNARLLRPVTWDGRSYNVVELSLNARPPASTATARIYIGEDLLVHRYLLQTKTPRGLIQEEWVFRNIRLGESLAPLVFAFKAHPDSLPFSPPSKGIKLLPVGSLAPDFVVHDMEGHPVRLSDYRGKTVVLDFWASWCWVCNKSLPSTAALAHKYRDQSVAVLGVVIWDTPKSFKAWRKEHDYPEIDFALDPKPQGEDVATKLYHVSVRPTMYVIDSTGKIRSVQEGFSGNASELEAAIRLTISPRTALKLR